MKELDLGVTFSRNMKFSNHIKIHVNKATGILSQLKRSFRYWTLDTCRTLYCAYVRPHLEYAAVVWSPPSKKDARLLEKVQRRATKLVPRIRNWRYKDRLAVLRLTPFMSAVYVETWSSCSNSSTASTKWIWWRVECPARRSHRCCLCQPV